MAFSFALLRKSARSCRAPEQLPEPVEVVFAFEVAARFDQLRGAVAAEHRIDQRVELADQLGPLRVEIGERDADVGLRLYAWSPTPMRTRVSARASGQATTRTRSRSATSAGSCGSASVYVSMPDVSRPLSAMAAVKRRLNLVSSPVVGA